MRKLFFLYTLQIRIRAVQTGKDINMLGSELYDQIYAFLSTVLLYFILS